MHRKNSTGHCYLKSRVFNCVNLQLKDLHAEELKRLATTQSKLQEQLKSDKEQVGMCTLYTLYISAYL